jgi:primosomal protein N' (replication factor Y)
MTKRGEFSCALCSLKNRQWRCKDCESDQFIIIKSGIEKVKDEISKSIPNIPLYTSTSEKELSGPTHGSVIVIATAGMEPVALEGYSAIILLDGEHIVSRPLVRAEEDALQRWFKTLQLLRKNGQVFVSLASNHRITQSIIAGESLKYLRNEIEERQRMGLPPSRTAIKIESKGENLGSLRNRLLKQFPSLTIHLSSDANSALILADSEILRECLLSIRALQKVRSIQSKSVYKIIVNPYHL